MKLTRKILASVLALVLVLLMVPAAFAAEETVYTLDVGTDMEVIAADAANAGKEIVVNDYFTVILGEKTRVDENSKTFDDGYAAAKRLNFQHKTKANDNGVILPAVKFTTSAAATIKLWWVAGDADRQFAILDEAGAEVTRTNDTLAKNDLCISELTLEAAGTYFLGTPDGSNYLFKMEVTEAAAEEPPIDEPVGESKTITINGATFTAEAGKWLYNTYVDEKVAGAAENAYMYNMIIFDKNYTGEAFNTNSYGAAIVLDRYGKLVRIYDGANGGFWTAEGKAASAHFTTATFATVAWSELQEGETLIIFPNDGASNTARKWALDLRGLNGTNYFGEIATLDGFTFETENVEPEGPSDTGDIFGIAVALMAISGIALVSLKKKEN